MIPRLAVAIALAVLFGAYADARSRAPVRAFVAVAPCPATGEVGKRCPGYVVDHIWPLCAGGADGPSNMQWQTKEESLVKDRAELEMCRWIRRAKQR